MNPDDLPLVRAAAAGDVDAVQGLLATGADVDEGIYGFTPLIAAAMEDRIDVVRLLLKRGAKVNATDVHEETALFYARSPETARVLLEAGADPDHRALCDDYPLSSIDDAETARVVLEAMSQVADVSYAFNLGFVYAARRGRVEMGEFHLEHGASVDGGPRAVTPLMDAAGRGHAPFVRFLLAAGADIHRTDSRRRTALHYAAAPEAIAMESHRFCLRLSRVFGEGEPTPSYPLNLEKYGLVVSDDVECIDLLSDAGVSIEARDLYDLTPLLLACAFGRSSRVAALLALGTDPKAVDRWRRDAVACARRNPDPTQRSLIIGALP